MTLEQFVSMTRKIVDQEGIEHYLPTLLLLDRREVLVLDEIPADVEMELAVQQWVSRTVRESENYMFAYPQTASRLMFVEHVQDIERRELITFNN